MKTISILNNKGGVAKTTTAIHLGAFLAQQGKKTLIIDFDPQASLSLLTRADTMDYDVVDFLDFKPNPRFRQVQNNLWVLKGTSQILEYKDKITKIDLRQLLAIFEGQLDYCIIDCGPGIISGKNNINEFVLTYTDYLITPIRADYASYQGVKILMDSIGNVKKKNPKLEFLGLLFSDINPREILFKEMHEKMKKTAEGFIFSTIIRKTVEIQKAEFVGKTIFQYNPNCTGAWDFKKFGEEVLEKIK